MMVRLECIAGENAGQVWDNAAAAYPPRVGEWFVLALVDDWYHTAEVTDVEPEGVFRCEDGSIYHVRALGL